MTKCINCQKRDDESPCNTKCKECNHGVCDACISDIKKNNTDGKDQIVHICDHTGFVIKASSCIICPNKNVIISCIRCEAGMCEDCINKIHLNNPENRKNLVGLCDHTNFFVKDDEIMIYD